MCSVTRGDLLSFLHDALPICGGAEGDGGGGELAAVRVADRSGAPGVDERWAVGRGVGGRGVGAGGEDRKSTRLNSSHPSISYAVFCLKKEIERDVRYRRVRRR